MPQHANIMESPEITEAINDQLAIDGKGNKWAKLFICHDRGKYRRVSLSVGNNGTIATHRIDYHLRKDGSVFKDYCPGL